MLQRLLRGHQNDRTHDRIEVDQHQATMQREHVLISNTSNQRDENFT